MLLLLQIIFYALLLEEVMERQVFLILNSILSWVGLFMLVFAFLLACFPMVMYALPFVHTCSLCALFLSTYLQNCMQNNDMR